MLPAPASGLDEAVDRGLLQVQGPTVAFAHELARQAVHDALPAGRRLQLHGALAQRLAAMPPRPGLLARRVHHAALAGRSEEVCALAPSAADEAARVASRRSAAQLLVLAFAHADAAGAGTAERSAWLEQLGRLRSGLHDLTGAMQAWREALVLHQAAGHSATGQARCRANLAVLLSPRPDAVDEARQACALMEPQPPGSAETALAHYALAVALTHQGQVEQALPHARAAVSAAESAGHAAALTQALSVCASLELSLAPFAAAFAMLERSIALASEARLADHAGARSRAQAVALLQRAADSPPVR